MAQAGGPGRRTQAGRLMRSSSAAARGERWRPPAKVRPRPVIGVTRDRIEHWRAIRANRCIGQEIRCRRLRQRLFQLTEIGPAMIALPRRMGSLVEVAPAWSLLQMQEISPRPLVVVGRAWRRASVLSVTADGGLRPEDAALVSSAADGAAARLVVRGLGQGSLPRLARGLARPSAA
jgi:predicted Rossmann-fold nucleotide-binding protein